jgi:hypothetical protein
MAGLDPAINVFGVRIQGKTWITGSSAVMTTERVVLSPSTRREGKARIC